MKVPGKRPRETSYEEPSTEPARKRPSLPKESGAAVDRTEVHSSAKVGDGEAAQAALTSPREATKTEAQTLPELPVELHLQILQHRAREMSGHDLLHLEQTLYGQDGASELWAHVADPFFKKLREQSPEFTTKMSQIVREGLPNEMVMKIPPQRAMQLAASVHVLGEDTAIYRQLTAPFSLARMISSAHQSGIFALTVQSPDALARLRADVEMLNAVLTHLEGHPGSRLGSAMLEVGRSVRFDVAAIESHLQLQHTDPVNFANDHLIRIMRMQQSAHHVQMMVGAAASATTL